MTQALLACLSAAEAVGRPRRRAGVGVDAGPRRGAGVRPQV